MAPVINEVIQDQHKLNDMEYADGTTLLTTKIDNTTESLADFHQDARKLGLQSSWSKTNVMYIGANEYTFHANADNQVAAFTESFTYLDAS